MAVTQRHHERAAILVPAYGKATRARLESEHLADEQRAVAGGIALLEDEAAVGLAVQGQQHEVLALHRRHADAGGEVALREGRRQPQVAAVGELAGRLRVAHRSAPTVAHSRRTSSTTCSSATATGSLSSAPGSNEAASTSSTVTSGGKPGPSSQCPIAMA